MNGLPLWFAVGAWVLENNVVEIARRDSREKQTLSLEGVENIIENLLEEIQQNLYNRALQFRQEHITPANSMEELEKLLDEKGGFISAHWDGTAETEEAIKEKTKATIRCIPLDNEKESGVCVYSGKPSEQRVLFARAY